MVTETLSASGALDLGPHSRISEVRRRFQDIARAEFRKKRKRLGVLSTEQEAAIEDLLITTVNKISPRVLAQMRRLIETPAETSSAITEVVGV